MVAIAQILPIYGAPPVVHATGRMYPAPLGTTDSTTLTTAATRMYQVPYLVTELRSYSGFVMRNAGAGDSGEKVRMGLYLARDGSLVKAATEVTFSGAAQDNVTADAFTPTEIGWHWIVAHFNAASVVKRQTGVGHQATAGPLHPNFFAAHFGVFSAIDDNQNGAGPIAGLYVDTTYAALAATIVAPTAVTVEVPWLALKA